MPQVASDQSFKCLILDRVACISDFSSVKIKSTSQNDGLARRDSYSALEVCNEFTVFLDEDGEVLEQFVVNALFNTDLRSDLVLECSHREGKRGEAFASLSEEGSCFLEFQVVDVLELALEYSGALVAQLGLTFTGRNVYV